MEDMSESNLTDDELANNISGHLYFSDEAKAGSIPRDLSTGNLEAAIGKASDTQTCPGPAGVTFQVVNYRIVREGHSKYVLYSIVILRTRSGLDDNPTLIERRYSDFEHLNSALHKKHAAIMRNIAFPKKRLTGNFKPETIAERSRAFEQFLAHIFSMDSLFISSEFSDFFYGRDLKEAYQRVVNGAYAEAIPLMKDCLSIQRKLKGDFHRRVLATLCALTAASYALERFEHAHLYAESALVCMGDRESKYAVPLLELSIRLCWQLGKEKADLEKRLRDLRKGSFSSEGQPTLLQLVLEDCAQ